MLTLIRNVSTIHPNTNTPETEMAKVRITNIDPSELITVTNGSETEHVLEPGEGITLEATPDSPIVIVETD